jgi:hypothetical protein
MTYTVTPLHPRMGADSGSFILTGAQASLFPGKALFAEPLTFVLSGSPVTMRLASRAVMDSGTFTLSGSAAMLSPTKVLVAETATFTLDVGDAGSIYERDLHPEPWSGIDALRRIWRNGRQRATGELQ